MPKDKSIRRGGLARGLRLSLAGARAGGAFAVDSALKKMRGNVPNEDALLNREARRFARELGELKGSYVKIGQLLALLGEHFLPAPLTQALHELEAQTKPVAWSEMESVFRTGMGTRYSELEIEPAALAAASLAQVHHARIVSTGDSVVVKGQYPDLVALLDEDFNTVVKMLRLARWIPGSRDFDSWLATLHTQLLAEVDYPRELRMAQVMAEGLAQHEALQSAPVTLRVPLFWGELCSINVLTMEYVEGHRAASPEVAALPQSARNALGKAMLQLFFAEVFDLGLVQTDPNFGNYLINDDGSELTLLDFGSVFELDATVRAALCDTIVAGLTNNEARLEHALVALGCLKPDAGESAKATFKAFIRNLLEPLGPPESLPPEHLNAEGLYCWGHSELINRTGQQVARSLTNREFAIPSGDFAMVARKLTGVFTFIAVLNAEFNGHDIVKPYLTHTTE
ncbi:MAG: AarF/UbiB family protein [Halieaceae bacterium]|jgi:predicted unusual protein kinase regulating ubiquinone biosynthesis (AarF/ABC1/UbiB family)